MIRSRSTVSRVLSAAAAVFLLARVAAADDDHGPVDALYLFQAPPTQVLPTQAPPQAAGPASLGQQPFPAPPPPSAGQGRTNQFNQLFLFESTPNICVQGQGYLSGQGQFYFSDRRDFNQFRFQLQGQYGVTDQWAVGAFVPYIHTEDTFFSPSVDHDGVGDIGLYAQYKFDQLVDPKILSLTGQLDVILPTGGQDYALDTGDFGVRPLVLAYKDFGPQGPGILGLYGLLGGTITRHSDVRVGFAVSYDVKGLAGVLEFTDTTGNRRDRPLTFVTPGLIYRGLRDFEFAAAVPLDAGGAVNVGLTLKVTYAFE